MALHWALGVGVPTLVTVGRAIGGLGKSRSRAGFYIPGDLGTHPPGNVYPVPIQFFLRQSEDSHQSNTNLFDFYATGTGQLDRLVGATGTGQLDLLPETYR